LATFSSLVALFIVSRVLLAATMGKLDTNPLLYYWQYADPKLLREDLLRTVFYLHSQPPLYNLFLGLGLKLFPKTTRLPFAACQYLTSLVFALALVRLMRRLDVPKTLAFLLTAGFILSPPYLSYEHWLFYDFYTAASLCGTALSSVGSWPQAGFDRIRYRRLGRDIGPSSRRVSLPLGARGRRGPLSSPLGEVEKGSCSVSMLPVALVLGVYSQEPDRLRSLQRRHLLRGRQSGAHLRQSDPPALRRQLRPKARSRTSRWPRR